jgi:3D (Asp-Asp-Asp) domain-containing protein
MTDDAQESQYTAWEIIDSTRKVATKYSAKGGKVYVTTDQGTRETSTAVGTSGRELERFERALEVARRQRGA